MQNELYLKIKKHKKYCYINFAKKMLSLWNYNQIKGNTKTKKGNGLKNQNKSFKDAEEWLSLLAPSMDKWIFEIFITIQDFTCKICAKA